MGVAISFCLAPCLFSILKQPNTGNPKSTTGSQYLAPGTSKIDSPWCPFLLCYQFHWRRLNFALAVAAPKVVWSSPCPFLLSSTSAARMLPPCLSNRNLHQLPLLSSPMFLNVERRSGDLGRISSWSCLTLTNDFGRCPWVAEQTVVPDLATSVFIPG